MAKSPLRAVMDIRRDELPLALLMFSYFFLVISSFWILKPLKKGLFIEYYDISGFQLGSWLMSASQAELLAKVLNMVIAFLAVVLFSWLSHRMRREGLSFAFTFFFMAAFVGYSFAINQPGTLTVWSFYLFGDLFSTLMVATFFAFMNDSVNAESAKRMYGLVGLGGVTGGVFGTNVLRVMIDRVPMAGWMWICFGIGLLILAVAAAAGAMVRRREQPVVAEIKSAAEPEKRAEPKANPALEGAQLVARSRYLLSIVAIVGLYEIVSTIMDFQFTATIAHYLDGEAIGRHFSTVYAITNWVSFLVQLFLTSFIMTRFGLTVALSVLPAAILVASGAFLALPALWIGSLLSTADNGFSYSINQSAKETLYVPTTRGEKYRAKAFIDMFVQRFAKALAVGFSLLITTLFTSFSSLRWLSLFTLVIIALWIMAVRYAGRRFREISATPGDTEAGR